MASACGWYEGKFYARAHATAIKVFPVVHLYNLLYSRNVNNLDFILLGMLRTAASGYELKQEFEMSIRHFWAAELSQIYIALKKLERKRLLRSVVAPGKKGPNRRIYRTTALGHAALRQWLSGEPIVADERFPYIGQIYFMDELGSSAKTADFIRRYRARIDDVAATMDALERRWRAEDPRYPDRLPAHDFHVHLTLRLAIAIAHAKLGWCEETLRSLAARPEKDIPEKHRPVAARPKRKRGQP